MRPLLLAPALLLASPILAGHVPTGGQAVANDGSGDGGAGGGSGRSGEGSGAGGGAGDASGADGGVPEPDCSQTNSCLGDGAGDPLWLPPDTVVQGGAFATYCANFPAACTDDGIPGDVRYYCLWHTDQCIRPEAQQPADPI